MSLLPLAVLYDRDDVQRFERERPDARAILALTSLAMVAATRFGIDIHNARHRYLDNSHARTILKRERLRAAWKEARKRINVASSVDYVFDLSFSILLHGYDRVHRVLGPEGPWLIPDGKSWATHETRNEAALALCRHILSRYRFFLGEERYAPPPFAPLYRWMRAVLVAIVRRGRPSWVATRGDHPLGLEKAVFITHPQARQWHVALAASGSLEYLRLIREICRGLAGSKQVQIRSVPRRAPEAERSAIAAIDLMPDVQMRSVLRAFAPKISALSGLVAGAQQDLASVLRHLKPDFMLASEVADGVTAALSAACRDVQIPRKVASHNSFSPVTGRVNEIALRDQMAYQYDNASPDEMLFWNPSSLAAARQSFPESHARLRAITLDRTQAAGGRNEPHFRVLHASNCLRYFSRADWLYENVDEFVEAAVGLVTAGLTVEGTRYTVRTKSRRFEMDEETLRAVLPEDERIEIVFRNDRPFEDDLARAGLLVAFRSTTIFQALQARIPVLLWGISDRYRELPARRTVPAAHDRAAVYSVTEAGRLAEMIRGIRDAHRNSPLTDDELAPYIWPRGVMTEREWAASL